MQSKIGSVVTRPNANTLNVAVAKRVGSGLVALFGHLDGHEVTCILSADEARQLGALLLACSFPAAGAVPPVLEDDPRPPPVIFVPGGSS
jgi:hypothetical protein